MNQFNVKSMLVALVTFFAASMAFAQDGHTGGVDQFASLAAGLGIGIAVFGGSLGQAKAATAFLDGVARNPSASDKMFAPMIIALALIESLVLYAFVITFVKIKI